MSLSPAVPPGIPAALDGRSAEYFQAQAAHWVILARWITGCGPGSPTCGQAALAVTFSSQLRKDFQPAGSAPALTVPGFAARPKHSRECSPAYSFPSSPLIGWLLAVIMPQSLGKVNEFRTLSQFCRCQVNRGSSPPSRHQHQPGPAAQTTLRCAAARAAGCRYVFPEWKKGANGSQMQPPNRKRPPSL